MSSEQNQNQPQQKQPKTPSQVTAQIKAQIKEAKFREVQTKAKTIIENITKTENLLKQYNQELEDLYADNSELFS